ncbi:LysR family transcriptional regulator [Paenibacillus sp. P36]|uniref:LysR family transcriptional regulator n=1 Tax=Paenibacillus sp. P36 TaxID=3342538 RepID=UPI0038B34BAA
MNLEQLNHIVATAKLKSLANAAKSLHITQSGLSQSITAFEKEIGYPIFNRTRYGAEVISEGSRIIQLASQALGLIEEIKKEAKQHIQIQSHKIKLAGIPGVMGSFIKLASNLKKHYPNVSIDISERGTLESIKEIEQGNLDAAFITINKSLLVSLAAYTFEPVSTGKIIIGVGNNSPFAGRSTITPEELKKQTFVLYNDDFIQWFIEDFENQFGKVNVLFESNNVEAVGAAVLELNTITIGHEYTFYEHPLAREGKIVPVELSEFQQSPVTFGWLLGTQKKSDLLDECITYFNQIRKS